MFNLKNLPDQVWITRDSDDETGELCSVVEIWAERPVRTTPKDTRGTMWMNYKLGAFELYHLDKLLGRVPVELAARYFTVPDTDRQVIVCPVVKTSGARG